MDITFHNIFLLLWSLLSGYGILFAIESFCYELLALDSMLSFALKGTVAILIGFSIGGIHFYITINDSDDMLSKVENQTSVELTELMSAIAGRIEAELSDDDEDIDEKESLITPVTKISKNKNKQNYKIDKTISLPQKISNELVFIKSKDRKLSPEDRYPSPEECFHLFQEAKLSPPRFLLPATDEKHIPPHIVALKFISKYNKKNK
eukprot:106768_1